MRFFNEITSANEYVDLARQRASLDALPNGDGHSVIVVPGFLASDGATTLLRRFVSGKGYDVSGWGLGRNRGSVSQFDALIDTVRDAAERSGAPISLIGWSLGGIASRWAAYHAPDSVRQIVTLGSPFNRDPRDMGFFPLYQVVGGVSRDDFSDERLAAIRATPVPPTTSIVSSDDPIAPPASGYQESGPTSETIEISGSHTGLVRNPEVWRIVADRLAQPADGWQPYRHQLLAG